MLWLVWHMWILLLLAFAGGVIAGWVLRSRSDEPPLRAALAAPKKPSSDPEPAAEAPPAPHVPAPGPSGQGGETSKLAAAFTAPEPSTPAAPKSSSSKATAAKSDGAKSAAGGEDLTAIKGLGPKAAEKLEEAGVTRVSQIAEWGAADIEKYDALVNARGRIVRDDWVGQAKALSAK